MRRRTSARSPFWLTERLGLTSQPTTSLARGEIETVKQPSPSTYPEMYAERNSRLRLGPASDRIHRLSPALRTAIYGSDHKLSPDAGGSSSRRKSMDTLM